MGQDGRTGARIRARRIELGVRQGELANAVGISSPYLNLIEHDHRRIGGRLLVALARALQVEPQALTQGADPALIEALERIAQRNDKPAAPAHEFASRYAEWARMLVEQHQRAGDLELAVRRLSERVGHDPQLAAVLHEVLSAVTSIRASSTILREEEELSPGWQATFIRNIHQDATRLAQCSRDLVSYLANDEDGLASPLPHEEFDGWLALRGTDLPSGAEARAMATAWLHQVRDDAGLVPLQDGDDDPLSIARRCGQSLPVVFRRLAWVRKQWGLISCDAAGVFILRLVPPGFHAPRLGAACALWPLFQAPFRPMQVLSGLLEQQGRMTHRFRYWAISEIVPGTGLTSAPVYRSHMLLAPAASEAEAAAEKVGLTCSLCPLPDCDARREQSILL